MAHPCVLYTFLLHSTGIGILFPDGADIYGYIGKGIIITCFHGWAFTNIKYFCRDQCGYGDILVKSDQTPTGRYTLKDHGAGTFTVSITDLQAEPILPIRRIRKLRRAPETPGGPLALKDVLILVSFLSLASGYENMNDHLF